MKLLNYDNFLLEHYKYTKDDMCYLLGKPSEKTFSNDWYRLKALLWLNSLTIDYISNGWGFNQYDRSINNDKFTLAKLAIKLSKTFDLTEDEMIYIRKNIYKYAKQMADISNDIKSGKKKRNKYIDTILHEWKDKNISNYENDDILVSESKQDTSRISGPWDITGGLRYTI